MKCSSCGHENLTDFPFCEQCLAMLPLRPGTEVDGIFDVPGDDAAAAAESGRRGRWPAFPWNPRDLDNPLIGRGKALRELAAGFDEVVGHWRGRIHLLVSDYGMGKGRVATELSELARKRDPDTLVVRVRCPSSGGPFRMWDVLVRKACGIPPAADDAEAGARLVKAVERFLPDEAEEVAALVAYLTGYDVKGRPEASTSADHEALISRSTAAIGRFLAAAALERPMLLIVDHATRASARSLALAGSIEAMVKGRPVMLVLSGSTELARILPGWERFPVTELGPLGRADAERMLRLFFEGLDDVPREILDRLLDRARGNPLSLKSMVRYVRQAGGIRMDQGRYQFDVGVAWDLDIPENLEGVVLAQYGGLTPHDHALLAGAALVGRQFWLGSLVAIERMDAAPADQPVELEDDDAPSSIRKGLSRLVGHRFIETRPSRIQGEEEYAFRADVYRDVALETLPGTTRQRLHRTVWQWLLLQPAHARDELRLDLAHHAEGAGEPGAAARYLLRAARGEHAGFRPEEERRHLEAAIVLADRDDFPTRISVGIDLGDALALAGDPDAAVKRYQEVLQLAWRMRNRAKGAAALARIGCVERDRGNHQKAYGMLLQALRVFEALEDHSGVARVCNDLGRMYWLRGSFDQALRSYRKSEDIYRGLRDRRGLAESVHWVGALHYDRGDLALAEEYLSDALELRRRIDDRWGAVTTQNALGAVWHGKDEPERAVDAWREAREAAAELGDRSSDAILSNNLGEALIGLGRYDEAEQCLERAVTIAREIEQPRVEVDALRNRGLLLLARQRYDAAQHELDMALAAAIKLGLPRLVGMVHRSRGELAIARAEAAEVVGDDARVFLAQAEAALRESADAFAAADYDLESAATHERLAVLLDRDGRVRDGDGERAIAEHIRDTHTSKQAGR